MNNKAYLDSEGLTYLCRQFSLQDYPNNEALMAVITAIDQTKADKNNTLSLDSEQTLSEEEKRVLQSKIGFSSTNILPIILISSEMASVRLSNSESLETLIFLIDSGSIPILRDSLERNDYIYIGQSLDYYYFFNALDIWDQLFAENYLHLRDNAASYIQLNKETGDCRLSVIQMENFISDYSENNSSKLSYIKNRPFYEETVSDGIAGTSYNLLISELSSATATLPNHDGEYNAYSIPSNVPIKTDQLWKIYFTNNEAEADEAVVYEGANGKVSIYGTIDLPYATIYNGYIFLNTFQAMFSSVTSVTLECINDAKTVIHKIDEKFIPDTIARASTIEPSENDIPTLYIDGTIPTSKAEGTSNVNISYISKSKTFKGYGTLKVQGNSSTQYPKKNFTLKMFKDSTHDNKLKVNFKNWGNQNKFVLKANWIDFSHARNIVSARLWGDVVRSRSDYNSLPEGLRNAPNQGAIDGFVVKVFCNNIYQGRYTLNIPKDKWTFEMDDSLDTNCILCAENYVSGCFQAVPVIDESDWTDELHDVVPDSIKTSWTAAISHVMNTSGEDFKNSLSTYFDVQSLIDYYCFSYAICHLDGLGKNQIFLTYDGTKWIASAYDMDSTFGLYWNGSRFVSTSYRMQGDYETAVNGTFNLLYEKLEANYVSEIKARWAELRQSALSEQNIIERFSNFCEVYSSDLAARDYNNYTGGGAFSAIPSTATNNLDQIIDYAVKRLAYVDSKMNSDSIGDSSSSGGGGDSGSGGTTVGNTTYYRQNYSPNGASWSDTSVTLNWENGDYVEIKADLTNCTGTMENIISLGSSINTWENYGYHVYYDLSNQQIEVNWMTGVGSGYRKKFTIADPSSVIMKFTATTVEVNGSSLTYANDISINANIISIGSQEGATRSYATYEYIKSVTS